MARGVVMKYLKINQAFYFNHSAAVSPLEVYSIQCLYFPGEISLIQHQVRLPVYNFQKHLLFVSGTLTEVTVGEELHYRQYGYL